MIVKLLIMREQPNSHEPMILLSFKAVNDIQLKANCFPVPSSDHEPIIEPCLFCLAYEHQTTSGRHGKQETNVDSKF